MSGWIASVAAAMVMGRMPPRLVPSVFLKSMVKVMYQKRVKTAAAYEYVSDFTVVGLDQNFEVTPNKVFVPASEVLHVLVEEYPTLNDAKPFIVRNGMLLRAVSFQERRQDGEWDGFWQELNLSKRAQRAIEVAEQDLKEQQ